MIRIWFNHWFSTVYEIIRLIKKDNSKFYIIGTNHNIYSPVRNVCDEWYEEPVLTADEYVDFCLSFCRDHGVDIFIPRQHMLAISQNKKRFETLGVKVMVDKYDLIAPLNDKQAAYQLIDKYGIADVPPYKIATTKKEFLDGYHELLQNDYRVCFKFVHDEGGQSFHLIDNDKKRYHQLFYRHSTHISLKDTLQALSERDKFSPIILMPYLSGEEVSVDCLNTQFGIIMIPRFKNFTRIEEIRYDSTIISAVKKFFEFMPLENPCDIQFKYLNGIPYFLEVNTRMSGGIQLSCLASKINIPIVAIYKLLGINKKWHNDYNSRKVSYIEKPLLINEKEQKDDKK